MKNLFSRIHFRNFPARVASVFSAKNHARSFFLVLGVLLAITVIVVPHRAHAQGLLQAVAGLFGIGQVLGGAIGWVFFVLNYIAMFIAGFAISIVAYFIEVLLAINTQIPNSILVKQGFQISLAVTNLFFVLGIIVIAIATIIRSQTYGMKQILWKLVVMAILVNFGLVLTAPIISFSDQLTGYFLNAFTPAAGGLSKYNAFATSLAGAFAPQRVFLNLGGTGDDISVGVGDQSVAATTGEGLGAIVSQIVNIFFPTLFLIFIGITLGVFVVMLFIRYVYLSYLLILLPFAWLAWVFPTFKSHFEKWWHHFIRWTFFAPIVVFFLYLAIITARAMSLHNAGDPLAMVQSVDFQSGNPILAGIGSLVGGFAGNIIRTLVQMATLLAISVGGLVMANSMGIKFADVGVKAATTVSKGFGNAVGRRTKQVGTAGFRTAAGQKFATSLQNFGANRGAIGRALSLPVRYLGGGMQGLAVSGGEKAVDAGAERMKGMTDEQVANAMARFTAPERIAALERLNKNGNFGMIKNPERYMEDKAMFERYNKTKAMEVVEGESGYGLMKRMREGQSDEEIKKYMRSAASAGNLAKTFLYSDAQLKEKFTDAGKDLPLGAKNIEEMHKIQDAIFLGVAQSFSGSNISQFYQQATKKDQLDAIPEIAQRLKSSGKLTSEAQLSDAARNYHTSSGARSIGISMATLGLTAPSNEEKESEKRKGAAWEEAQRQAGAL